MRDVEIQKVRYERSFTRKHVLTRNHGTKAVDRSGQYDQNVDQSPDSDDGNNPTNEHQPTEEETGQDESNEITPPERRCFSRNSRVKFNVAQVTSAGESDDELSDPLPLGYWRLWKALFYFFKISFCLFILLTFFGWYFSCRDTRPSLRNIFAVFLELLTWTSKYSDIMPWPHQESTKQNLRCKWKANTLQWEHKFMMDNLQNLSIQLSKSWQEHSPKLDLGL